MLSDRVTRWHQVWEACNFCVYEVDASRQLIYANPAFLALYGLELEAFMGLTANEFYPPDLAEKYQRDDMFVLNNKAVFSTIEHNEDPESGIRRVVEVVKAPVLDVDGQVIGIRGLFWDITPEIQAHKDMTSYWQRMLMLHNVDNFLLIDDQAQIVIGTGEMNGAFVQYVSEHERGQVMSHVKRAFRDQSVELFSMYTAKSEQFWSCRIVPSGEDGQMAALFIVDVTEHVSLQPHTERDLRLGLLTQYSAAVAHDLNNLFTVLMCNASLLEPKDEEEAELVEDILAATKRSQGLVAQMRSFVQPNTTSYEWVDVRAFFEEKSFLLDRILGRETRLEILWPEINGEVYINPSRFEQLLLSLLRHLQGQVQQPLGLEIAIMVPCDFPPTIQIQLGKQRQPLDMVEPNTQEVILEAPDSQWRELVFADYVMRLFGGSFQASSTPERGVVYLLELPLSLQE